MRRSLAAAIWLTTLASFACSEHVTKENTTVVATEIDVRSAQQKFVTRFLGALEHNDVSAWHDLLSLELRTRLADPAMLQQSFDAWHAASNVPALRTAVTALSSDQRTLVFQNAAIVGAADQSYKVHVVFENGEFRINES